MWDETPFIFAISLSKSEGGPGITWKPGWCVVLSHLGCSTISVICLRPSWLMSWTRRLLWDSCSWHVRLEKWSQSGIDFYQLKNLTCLSITWWFQVVCVIALEAVGWKVICQIDGKEFLTCMSVEDEFIWHHGVALKWQEFQTLRCCSLSVGW